MGQITIWRSTALDDADERIAELRAVLAPLLDFPICQGDEISSQDHCIHCGKTRHWTPGPETSTYAPDDTGRMSDNPEFPHADGCLVRRADELLGRHGASRQATRRATS